MKIILSNDLPQDKKIKIKESNAGILRFLANLAPGQLCTLKHDPHGLIVTIFSSCSLIGLDSGY